MNLLSFYRFTGVRQTFFGESSYLILIFFLYHVRHVMVVGEFMSVSTAKPWSIHWSQSVAQSPWVQCLPFPSSCAEEENECLHSIVARAMFQRSEWSTERHVMQEGVISQTRDARRVVSTSKISSVAVCVLFCAFEYCRGVNSVMTVPIALFL